MKLRKVIGWTLMISPLFCAGFFMGASIGIVRSMLVLVGAACVIGILALGAWLTCGPDDQ